MANFAVAASPETIEKANKIMEIYAQNGDKKEDTLLRILDLAEAESVKGTHPALEPNLKAIEKTLGSLLNRSMALWPDRIFNWLKQKKN